MTDFDLQVRDILQIDATVITGILILLTLSLASDSEIVTPQQITNENATSQQQKSAEVGFTVSIKTAEAMKTGWAVTIIVPFAISAWRAINEVQKLSTPNFGWSITFMKIDFLYIIMGIGAIGLVQLLLIYFPHTP